MGAEIHYFSMTKVHPPPWKLSGIPQAICIVSAERALS